MGPEKSESTNKKRQQKLKTYPGLDKPFFKDFYYNKELVHDGCYYRMPFDVIILGVYQKKLEKDAKVTKLKLITANLWYWKSNNESNTLDGIYTSGILTFKNKVMKSIVIINLTKMFYLQSRRILSPYRKVGSREVDPKKIRRRINYNKSKDPDFLEALSIESNTEPASDVCSYYAGNWYFENVHQGYLLNFLLNTLKIHTLDLITQSYFILFTSLNHNVNIQINFNLIPKLLSCLVAMSSNTFSSEAVDWNEDHINILRRLAVFHTYVLNYELSSLFKEKQQPLKIQFANESLDQAKSLSNKPSELVDTELWTTSHKKYADMINLYKELSTTSYKKYANIFNSYTVTDVTTVLSVEDLSSIHQEKSQLKKIHINQPYNSHGHRDADMIPIKLKPLLADIRQKFKLLNIFNRVQNIFECNLINETIFATTFTVDLYQKYLKPLFTRKFVVMTLVNLGKTLGNL